MTTEYFRLVRDCGTWDSPITTIRVTRNALGNQLAEFVGQCPVNNFWTCLLRSIECGRTLPAPFAVRKL